VIVAGAGLIAFAAGGIAAAVLLSAVAVALPPSRRERMLRTLAAFGGVRATPVTPRRSPADVLRPHLQDGYQRIADALAPGGARDRLIRMLDYAGNPPAWPVDRVIRARLFGMVVFAFFWWMFARGVAPGHALLGFPLGAAFGLYLPDLLVFNAGSKRQKALGRTLPDVLDAMVIGVEAGLGLDSAMVQVAQMLRGPMPDELHRVLQEMQLGVARSDALRALSARTTVRDLRTLVTALIQSGELGISVAGILREHAADQRLRRRQRAEEQAQKVAVKMLFPVLLCFFPAIFVVVVGPAVLHLIKVFS
jgi:tight adherence protein C